MKRKPKFGAPTPKFIPLPLSVEDADHLDHEGKVWIVNADCLCVAEMDGAPDGSEDRAALIVRAVNARAGLVAALRSSVSALETPGDLTKEEIGHVIEDGLLALRAAGEEV